jgi:hypothetical protein
MPKLSSLLFAMALVLFGAMAAFAQADVSTATLKGTITDQTAGRISDALVVATDTEHGSRHESRSDSLGAYQIPFLVPSTYDVRVEKPGFETQLFKGIQLTVGQIAVVDAALKVGTVSTEVAVNTEAPLVEVEKTQQANTINTLQVQNLPNITRNFFAPVYTLPGVSSSNAPRNQGNGAFNFGTSGFSIGGSNGRSNLITVDGGENEFGDGEPRYLMSPEVVQEFQVNRNAFAAEFGFTAGTAVNVVTKSGTNSFHGSVYTFYRSQHTSARNFFDRRADKAFDQQIYPGATFGGPLVKNKLFIFQAYEFLKSDTARFRNYTDNPSILGPTAAEAAYLARMNASSDPNIRRIAGSLTSALTATNFPNTMKLLTAQEGDYTSPARVHTWTSRVDYQMSPHDSLSGRFSLFHSDADQVGNNNTVAPSNATQLFSRDYTTVISWIHNVSSNIVNQARVQFSPNVSARTIPNDPKGAELIIQPFGTFGRTFTGPFNTFENRFQFEDDLTWIKGGHTFKFGGSYRPVKYHVIDELWFGGQWTFQAGIFPMLLALPPADQGALVGFNGGTTAGIPTINGIQGFSLGLPFLYRQGFGNPDWQDWSQFVGLFAQDSWKIGSRFTLDYGVRFDHDAEPNPLGTYNHVSPRLGFAWDPFGDHKTVIRAGGGIFQAPALYQVAYLVNLLNDSGRYINQIFKTPATPQTPAALWNAGLQLGRLPFQGLTAADAQTLNINTGPKNPGRVIFEAAHNYRNTYSIQSSFGITRELLKDLSLDLAYQMYRGVHIQLDHEINYRDSGVSAGPGLGPKLVAIDPTITQFNLYSPIGNSIYHGMTVSLNKRYSSYTQFHFNYTFSKSIDDATDYNSGFAAYLPTNLHLERAISSFNITHNFVADAVLRTPFHAGDGHNALARIFADMTVAPVIFLRTGIPFTVLLGGDFNGDTHPNDRPFLAGRNTGIGEPFYGVDLRISKTFYARRDSSFRGEFIAEATNLLNHTNFLSVNNNVGNDPKFLFGPFNLRGDRTVPSTSPLGFTSAGDPRRIQLAIKLAF